MELRYLSPLFYQTYGNCPEIMSKGESRPYNIILVEVENNKFAIPIRTKKYICARMPGGSGFYFTNPALCTIVELMERNELALMKAQLLDMTVHPERYEAALKGGFVCAGFGGDLNGVHVPETLLKGRLPAGVTPQQALQEVIAIMKKTISEAELAQNRQKYICN